MIFPDLPALTPHAWIPGPREALLGAGAGLVVGVFAGAAAGALHDGGRPVAYTRKVFHFAVFTAAAAIYFLEGLATTNAFGVVVAGLVMAAVRAGRESPLFRALARPGDRPHEAWFILVPLVATAVGGLAAAFVAGKYAAVGYLVAGWGDAVGEPVGRRWGRHRYRVPSLRGVAVTRSWEGSLAVFVVSALAAGVTLYALERGDMSFTAAAGRAVLVALVAAGVEAWSSHGLDNLTVPVAAAWLAALTAGGG
ncbi:MAG: diacylglycerol/polyprenol kinase family protein [Gemmatimonadota bacterium]